MYYFILLSISLIAKGGMARSWHILFNIILIMPGAEGLEIYQARDIEKSACSSKSW